MKLKHKLNEKNEERNESQPEVNPVIAIAMTKMRMAMMAVAPLMEETVTRKSSVTARTGR